MSIVADEKEIRSLRRYIELYEGDPYVAEDVAQASAVHGPRGSETKIDY